ncbi:class I adenylate-forming enzyme family protein [Shouchella shacheensis]|uniref:class I adenylate-forming enzyme family protein n=1 Tax=Shouchella shacheensis TaxID=1649580 RepID=UPI00074049C3|nr:long-chain fatty acid--CoA ligase [Shouchella shacheensis]
MSTFSLLTEHLSVAPHKPAIEFLGQTLTYSELTLEAEQLAAYLQQKGLKQGDTVALLLSNNDDFVVAYFACQAAGFVCLPLNVRLSEHELSYILSHSEATCLLYETAFTGRSLSLQSALPALTEAVNLTTYTREERLPLKEANIDEQDTAVLFYTSGTTGKPKGVLLSHGNCLAIASMWKEALSLTREERTLLVAPLFHCAASHVFMLPTLAAGGTAIIHSGFDSEQVIEALEQENVTLFFGVPAMYNLLLQQKALETVTFPALKTFAYGAAPMPYERIKQLKTLFPHVRVQNLYGQTENAPGATTLKDPDALTKIGSVGTALPSCEVQVVDTERRPVAQGETGEIAVKGPHVMKGYFKNPEATTETIQDGWLLTGDLGRMDEDGYLYVVDRKKDMLIRGGENIYPLEIEEVLFELPGVVEAAVIGIPHPVLGEVPKAVVVTKEGASLNEEEVIRHCASKLARYKCPAEVEFCLELPRNASGKVLKFALREQAKELSQRQ